MTHARAALVLGLILASGAAQGADETLILSPVYPSSSADRQSYLRLVNLGTSAGKVTAVVKDEQGRTLGTWTKTVAANTTPQVGAAEIEAALNSAPGGNLRLEITSNFYGYVQHAVWNPGGGALTNLSNCGVRAISDVHSLTNVHSTLLKGTYPSTIVIANRGSAAGAASIDVFDGGTGTKLGTYVSPSVAAGGHVSIPEESIEQAINLHPNATQYHFTLKLTGAFQGSMAHLVDNFGAGVITDMTQRCTMFGPPPSSFATADVSQKLTYIGDYSPFNVADSSYRLVDFAQTARLGPEQREGVVIAGWKFSGSFANKLAEPFATTNMMILEQGSDGLLSIATSKYVPSAETNGAGAVLAADFNGDGKDDIFLPAHNETPNVDKASTIYLSKSDGTFDATVLSDSVQAHGSGFTYFNGKAKAYTAGYGPTSENTYEVDTTGKVVITNHDWPGSYNFLVNPNHPAGSANSAGSPTVGDFLGSAGSGLQIFFSDVYTGNPGATNGGNVGYEFGGGQIKFRRDPPTFKESPYFFLPKPYYNDKPAYASYTGLNTIQKTHNAQIWSFDVNNDGLLDVIIQAEIYPGKPYPNSEYTGDWAPSKLQIDINRGGGTFTDDTDTLNTDFLEQGGLDEREHFIPDEGTGLLGVATRGWGVLDKSYNYVPGTTGNRIFLNDGTGRLHLVMQDELMTAATQAQQLMDTKITSVCKPGAHNRHRVKLASYRTPSGNFNFVASYAYTDATSCAPLPKAAFTKFALVNVPLDINLFADYRENITISNRNGSKKIRTFGGDDVIIKKAGDPDCVIDGGVGRDRVVYAGNRSAYTVTKQADGSIKIKDNATGGTTDTLINIETAQFADGSVDLY